MVVMTVSLHWCLKSKIAIGSARHCQVGRSVRDRVATPFVAEAQEFEAAH